MLPRLELAAELIAQRCGAGAFSSAIILGSGLGDVADSFSPSGCVNYVDIPGFPSDTIPGHAGKLLWAEYGADRLLLFQGRFHLYQGISVYDVVSPIVLASILGCNSILITNAAGGINADFAPGDPVYVSDHINLSGDSPLRGLTPPPFLDVSTLYQPERYSLLKKSLLGKNITLHQGTLAYMPGPNYETPAEIEMLRRLGADLVSMSTVQESLAAHYLGLRVTAFSIIANAAAGLGDGYLDHQEVLDTGKRSTEILSECLRSALSLDSPHNTL